MATNDQIVAKLAEIADKLNGAKVLNGGFDKLSNDMEETKESISHIRKKITEIKTKINDPEEGIIIRIRDLEKESDNRQKFINTCRPKINDLDELIAWKNSISQDLDNAEQHMLDIDRLKIWKTNTSKMFWLFGSTIAAMFVKMLWDAVIQTGG